MSGLAALVRFGAPPDIAPFGTMLRRMDARGPDARREERIADGVLGVCANGFSGPAWDAARRWCVVTDGEWTNLAPLRKELATRLDLRDDGAAGVAAAVIAEIGLERGLSRLRGDVALVAWDAVERQLWAVRDRTGTRPMHYATLPDGTALVASHAASILAHPRVDRRPDPEAIHRIVVLGFCAPPQTPWASVRKVGAGCMVRIDATGASELRYWSDAVNPAGAAGARYRWARSIGYAIELAVGQRCGGEVAVAHGGGLYSAAILGAATARNRRVVPLEAAFGDIDDAVATFDEPLVDPAAVAWLTLAQAAADRGCTALLTGVGGAELFGGPGAYLGQRAAALPGSGLVGGLLGARGGGWARRQVRWRGEVLSGEESDALWADVDVLAAACPDGDEVGRALWLDRQLRLPEGPLAWVDRACAVHGLVARHPLADPDLVTLVTQVPAQHLVGGIRKPRGLFADAMVDRVPVPPKHVPMRVPIDAEVVRPQLAERLEGLADPDAVRRMVEADRVGRLWALEMVARWRERWAG